VEEYYWPISGSQVYRMYLIQILLPLYDNRSRRLPNTLFDDTSRALAKSHDGVTIYTRSRAIGLWNSGAQNLKRTRLSGTRWSRPIGDPGSGKTGARNGKWPFDKIQSRFAPAAVNSCSPAYSLAVRLILIAPPSFVGAGLAQCRPSAAGPPPRSGIAA
jgi:hypothetical protein